jgi:hypothetical protein
LIFAPTFDQAKAGKKYPSLAKAIYPGRFIEGLDELVEGSVLAPPFYQEKGWKELSSTKPAWM